MLKMTKIELEKINDPGKYMFFEQGMRGGVSILIKGIVKQIINVVQIMIKQNLKNIDLDMNNLCGHAMSQYLPNADFKWVKNIDKFKQKLMNIKSNSSTGYILEVDL